MAIYERMTVKGRTGALQTYNGQAGTYTPGAGVNARLDAGDQRIVAIANNQNAQAMGGLADAVKKGAAKLEGAYLDYSKSKATELMNEYRSQMKHVLSGEGGILSRVGEAAFTAGDDTLTASSKLRAELLKEYGGDSIVAHMFNNVVFDAENDFHLQAVGHQDKEYKSWQDRTDKAAIDQAQDDAATNYGNAELFAKHAGTAMHHMRDMLIRQGYSGEALDRGLVECSSKIFKAGINRAIANNDLGAAERLLREGERFHKEQEPHDLSKAEGLLEKGNIDPYKRKVEKRADGTIATVESFSVNIDGKEVLLPRVIDGKTLSEEKAIEHFNKTGEHLGKFDTPEHASEYAQKFHENQAAIYGEGRRYMTGTDIDDAKMRIQNKKDVLQAKAEAAAAKAERAREKAAAAATAAKAAYLSAGFESVFRELPSDWTEEQKAAHMTKLVMDKVQDPKLLGSVMKDLDATMKRAALYDKAGKVEDERRAEKVLSEMGTTTDVRADGSTFERPLSASEQIRAIQSSEDLSDQAKSIAISKVTATPTFKAEMERASSDGLAQFRSWFDHAGATASDTEVQAKIGELGISGKDVDRALDYRGKHAEYSQERLKPLVKRVTGKDDDATVSKYYTAIMNNPRVKAGETLKDDDLRSMIYTLSSKGETRSDGTTFFTGSPTTSRSGSTYLDAVLDGKGSTFSLQIPTVQIPVLNQEAENMWPGAWQKANADVKQLVREVLWNRKQGITMEFTDRERKMLKDAGFGGK